MQSISAHVVGNGGGRGGGHVFKQEREASIATVLEELTVLLSDDKYIYKREKESIKGGGIAIEREH